MKKVIERLRFRCHRDYYYCYSDLLSRRVLVKIIKKLRYDAKKSRLTFLCKLCYGSGQLLRYRYGRASHTWNLYFGAFGLML